MKKRLMTIALAMCILCMGLLCTSCGESAQTVSGSAVDTFNNAIVKTQDMDSMEAKMTMEMDMTVNGETMSVPVVANIKGAGLKGSNPTVYSEISMEMMGTKMDMKMYQEGEWAYIDVSGMQYKVNMEDGGAEYDYTDDIGAMLKELPEELFDGVDVKEDANGNATVEIKLPDEMFAEIFNDLINNVNESADGADMTVEIADATVKMSVVDGYISTYDIAFNMDMDMAGVSTTTSVKASVEITDPGSEVTVTPLEGYESFQEIDMSSEY